MPPKTGRAKTPYPAQRLSEINVNRARSIAGSLKIADYSSKRKADLIPLIRDQLALVEVCQPCGGGPCRPDEHVFPEVTAAGGDDTSSDLEGEGTEGGNASLESVPGDDSPSRSVLRSLNGAKNHDEAVPSATKPTSFEAYVHDELFDATVSHSGPGPSHRTPGTPAFDSFEVGFNETSVQHQNQIAADTRLPSSNGDTSEEDEEFSERIAEIQARQEREAAELRASLERRLAEEQKKAELARKQRERKKSKQARQQKKVDDREKAHQDYLQRLRDEAQSRISAVAGQSADDDVFQESTPTRTPSQSDSSAPSSRARSDNRVSFPQFDNRQPRSESARPAPNEFHPEYQASPKRTRSTGASIDQDIVSQLMAHQSETTKVLAAALEKLATNNAGQVPISALSGFDASSGAPSCAKSNSGNLQLIEPENPEMARELGLNVPLNWALNGPVTSVDISKIKKSMVSGKHRSNQGLVLRQQFWPHDCVSAASSHLMPDGAVPTFDNLMFAQYQEGMIQKVLIEASSIDIQTKNKLRFQNFLIKLSYSLTWQQVRSIGDRFLDAWENKTVEWDDWEAIKTYLKDAAEQTRLAAALKPTSAPGALSGAPHGNLPRPGNPKPMKKRGWITDANGVPWSYMKGKTICCQFNVKECPHSGDHKIGEHPVHHWCGGCFATSKGSIKEAHPAMGCKKGPFNNKSLFQ